MVSEHRKLEVAKLRRRRRKAWWKLPQVTIIFISAIVLHRRHRYVVYVVSSPILRFRATCRLVDFAGLWVSRLGRIIPM